MSEPPRELGRDRSAIYRGLSVAAPAKLNLGLRVLGRRPDGYHLLRSEFVCIGLWDVLRVRVSPAAEPAVELAATGLDVPPGDANLAVRAADLFLAATGARVRVEIGLDKRIPLGAGLGGGSSDAGAVLRALNRLLEPVPPARLREWALSLGADVPFFLDGRPALVEGIGERLSPLRSWPRASLVVAFGGRGLSTAEVFRRYDASLTSRGAASTIRVSARGQKGGSATPVNDLEAAAIQIEPGVEKLKEALLARGGAPVVMTGSGAAVYGCWPDPAAAASAAESMRMAGWWAVATEILDRIPQIES